MALFYGPRRPPVTSCPLDPIGVLWPAERASDRRPACRSLQLAVQLAVVVVPPKRGLTADRSVHGFQYLEHVDIGRTLGEAVAAVRPLDGQQHAGGDEGLEHLQQEALRNAPG